MTIYDDYDGNFRAGKNRHIPSYRHKTEIVCKQRKRKHNNQSTETIKGNDYEKEHTDNRRHI